MTIRKCQRICQSLLAAAICLTWTLPSHGQNETLTFGYSNLLDGGLELQNRFEPYEMVLAVEEALGLWAQYIPVDFVEQPAGQVVVGDSQYSSFGQPQILLGHHGLDGNTLAHAFGPGFGGLAYDVHMDSSNRVWSEDFFLTTMTHELGHSIGINDHIEGVTAIMNASIGASNNNLMEGLGEGYLFAPDIAAARREWGRGSGEVITRRVWQGGNSKNWSTHGNWDRGWRPSATTDVYLQSEGTDLVIDQEQSIRSLTLGAAQQKLAIENNGELTVRKNLQLGSLDGGSELVSEGAPARTRIPTNSSLGRRWQEADFNDANWIQGRTGIGYDTQIDFRSLIETDVRSSMRNRNASLYTRLEFEVEDPAEIEFMTLRMRYDDGFVAYLNGNEIASANAPGAPVWNSRATGQADDDEAVLQQTFDISMARESLVPGRNLLAIQGLNIDPGSSDMLISPALSAGKIRPELRVEGELKVGGDLVAAESRWSNSTLVIDGGHLTVAGDLQSGNGKSRLELRNGTLQVQGAANEQIVIDANNDVRYFVPFSDEVGPDWITADFDDSRWRSGSLGIGYDENADYGRFLGTDVESRMRDRSSTLFTRIEFELDSASDVDELMLDMRFDDGFVAYLNGERVLAQNAPGNPRWNSRATRSANEEDTITPNRFNLSSHRGKLRDGDNVLAIHGLNRESGSSDFLLHPKLSWRDLGGTISVDQLDFWGGEIRDTDTIEADFQHQGGSFSPTRVGGSGKVPGELTIRGSYRMSPNSELRLDFEGTDKGEYDVINVEGSVTLAGTLRIETASTFPMLEPSEPGTKEVLTFLAASSLEGDWQQIVLDSVPLENHVEKGLFRSVEMTGTEVSWVSYRAYPGDANGDQRFNSTDLVDVFQDAEYEDSIPRNSDWTEGDWTGDQEFDSADLVLALQTGLYDAEGDSVPAVPEPGGLILLTLGFLSVSHLHRQQRRKNDVPVQSAQNSNPRP